MTEKQKQAIRIINKAGFEDDEYFLLLEFIIDSDRPQFIPNVDIKPRILNDDILMRLKEK